MWGALPVRFHLVIRETIEHMHCFNIQWDVVWRHLDSFFRDDPNFGFPTAKQDHVVLPMLLDIDCSHQGVQATMGKRPEHQVVILPWTR